MADIITPEQRSYVMSQVRGKDTGIEKLVRSLLHKKGFRFRKNVQSLPGKPDIVLPKYKTAIFVHGCFWHQHQGCAKSRRPSSNVEFWNAKLDKNTERDAKNVKLLREAKLNVITVWECELKNIEYLTERLINEITAYEGC